MGKFPFKRPRIISKKFPELDSSIDGVTKSLDDLVFSYHEQVGKALTKKHWLMAFSSIALLLVLGSFISMRGKADSSVFYPETCLGGWINPDNAQGEQQTTSNGDETQFTKENSAILPKNTEGDMYCGNFKGKFDAATRPTKIIVSLALTKGAELTQEDLMETGIKVSTTTASIPELASSTASSTLTLASTTENTLSTTTETAAEASTTAVGTAVATPGAQETSGPSIIDGIIESLQDTVHDIFTTSEATKTDTDTVIVPPLPESVLVPETQSTVTPSAEAPAEPVSAPAEQPASPTSFFPSENIFALFFDTVFAEEVVAETTSAVTVETVTTTPTADIVEAAPPVTETPQPAETVQVQETQVTTSTPQGEIVPVQDTALEPTATTSTFTEVSEQSSTSTENGSSTVLGVSTSTEVSLSTSTDIVGTTTPESNLSTSTETTDASLTQNNFLEVFYTFDGKTWESLGVLNEISMKYRTFEIPVNASTSWSDMSKLQIKIEARKHEEDTPVVYLDGVKVEVLYETTLEHVHPDFTRDTILNDETIDMMRIVTIINNDTNREEVWYMYLDTIASSTTDFASSTQITGTSTLATSTTETTKLINDDSTHLDIATSTSTAPTTLSLATSTSSATSTTSTSTLLIKQVVQKNVWLKYDGKSKGMSTFQLVEVIKKVDEQKLENKDEARIPDFTIDTIKKITGTSLHDIVVQVEKNGIDELWVYDIEKGTQTKISTGSSTSVSSTYPIGIKGGHVFWLSKDEGRVFAYNLETKEVYSKVVPPYNSEGGERIKILFDDISWAVVISAEGFFFYTEGSGEVFSDDNSLTVEEFRKVMKLDDTLSKEEIDDLNLLQSQEVLVETE